MKLVLATLECTWSETIDIGRYYHVQCFIVVLSVLLSVKNPGNKTKSLNFKQKWKTVNTYHRLFLFRWVVNQWMQRVEWKSSLIYQLCSICQILSNKSKFFSVNWKPAKFFISFVLRRKTPMNCILGIRWSSMSQRQSRPLFLARSPSLHGIPISPKTSNLMTSAVSTCIGF